MTSIRGLLVCGMGLLLATVAGCQQEEAVQPPPAPPAADAPDAKDVRPAANSSKVNEGMSSSSGADTTQKN